MELSGTGAGARNTCSNLKRPSAPKLRRPPKHPPTVEGVRKSAEGHTWNITRHRRRMDPTTCLHTGEPHSCNAGQDEKTCFRGREVQVTSKARQDQGSRRQHHRRLGQSCPSPIIGYRAESYDSVGLVPPLDARNTTEGGAAPWDSVWDGVGRNVATQPPTEERIHRLCSIRAAEHSAAAGGYRLRHG